MLDNREGISKVCAFFTQQKTACLEPVLCVCVVLFHPAKCIPRFVDLPLVVQVESQVQEDRFKTSTGLGHGRVCRMFVL